MTLKNKKKYVVIFSLIIILDQASKIVIQSIFNDNPYKVIHVIKNFFLIRYVENKGAVWGIFSQSSNTIIPKLITIFSLAALVIVIYFFLKLESKCAFELTSLSFIIGGAVGNLIDRLKQGYVVDFLEVYVKNFRWPTFNVADSFISIGVILLIISIWRGKCTQF
ncbi:MAG: signal peptidase II [Candidatus Aminicenantes bacterium]|nr:signal peptidase II [Candidatus Aminicenantes bacterium]NIM82135.1 signal peptidase II [Candidatus Aminicenantes bacterium]NIN21532.1 signal peptidase II [Candidatus Aminicenantes bacterium]NIN45341.1 signal peptidase II [Candidatus Aminicenantes bacterium]NIN88162.1 signal peptidase II [Candidatus Aminicenantes bacterium]